jgi:predicted  nucleic acid-binding Zn-ribbon protein
MKTLTASRLLTLASICLYSLAGFRSLAADEGAKNKVAPQINPQTQMMVNPYERSNSATVECTKETNQQFAGTLKFVKQDLPLASSTSYLPAAPIPDPTYEDESSQKYYASCYQKKLNTGGSDDQKDCKAEADKIDKWREAIDTNCAASPKTDSNEANLSIGKCLENAVSCAEGSTGNNDSVDKCGDMTLDQIVKTGAGNVAMKTDTYCAQMYPPACGASSVAGMHTTANEIMKDLNLELKDLATEKKDKQKDIQSKIDDITKANQELADLPTQFSNEFDDLKKAYEKNVQDIGDTLDKRLDGSYAKIPIDEAAITDRTNARIDADSAVEDAKDQYNILCANKAEAEASSKFPIGSNANVGSAGGLITLRARHQTFYLQRLNFYKSQGTSCDGGKYASAKRNATKFSDLEAAARVQLARDQQQLQLDIQKVAIVKKGALAKEMQDQSDRVTKLTKSQQMAFAKKQAEIAKMTNEKAVLDKDMTDIDAKIAAGPTKRNCVQVMHQCATNAGLKRGQSDSSSDVANVLKAESAAIKIRGSCVSNAKCNSSIPGAKASADGGVSPAVAEFTKSYPKMKAPKPDEYWLSPVCLEIYAAVEDSKGTAAVTSSADRKSKARSSKPAK